MRKIKDQASTVQILTILSLCPAATAGLQVNLLSGPTRADNSFIAASGTNLVAPNHTLGWILLLGVVVSIS